MSKIPEFCYWNGNSKHQDLVEKLHALIPAMGEVANPRKNPALERFRKAQNCYYDLYNNGLCNRARSFSRIFKIAASNYGNYRGGFSPCLYTHVEREMDLIVEAAAKEQGLML